MVTSNRSFTAQSNPKNDPVVLEVLKETNRNGRRLSVGQTIEVSKSEARRLLISAKGVYRITLD